jgi:hypothetical protein
MIIETTEMIEYLDKMDVLLDHPRSLARNVGARDIQRRENLVQD